MILLTRANESRHSSSVHSPTRLLFFVTLSGEARADAGLDQRLA